MKSRKDERRPHRSDYRWEVAASKGEERSDQKQIATHAIVHATGIASVEFDIEGVR